MREADPAPDADSVPDAIAGNWVDQRAPLWMRPYLKLSRLDRPIGSWLLFIPCLWGVVLAVLFQPEPAFLRAVYIILLCGAGAVLMRGAGCTWNDLTDRKIDAQVQRTRNRPLASGQLRAFQAIIWLALQLGASFLILVLLPGNVLFLGIAALFPVVIYPFAKRFTSWPQLFLGIAINWGAMLGFAAQMGSLSFVAFAAYAAGIFWTLFYDTIYAHQDREDDALIGVGSTAITFGSSTPKWLFRFAIGAFLFLSLAIYLVIPMGIALGIALIGSFVFFVALLWQIWRFDMDNPDRLLAAFRNHREIGLLPVPFLVLAMFL